MLGSKLNKIEFLSSGRLEAPNGDLLTSNHSMIIITIIKVGKRLYTSILRTYVSAMPFSPCPGLSQSKLDRSAIPGLPNQVKV